MKTATVIIPTIGNLTVKEAIASVTAQTIEVNSHVFVDGPRIIDPWLLEEATYITELAECTGKVGEENFWGHRSYSASPHLTNSDYVLFLDDDNWYEPNHVESLVELCERNDLHFAFSRRKIVDPDGKYICDDNCESLGFIPVWNDLVRGFHVDTSAYCFRRDFLIKTSHFWHGGYAQDRKFFAIASGLKNVRYGTTNQATLNYRLGSTETSASENFFLKGNDRMRGFDFSKERINV